MNGQSVNGHGPSDAPVLTPEVTGYLQSLRSTINNARSMPMSSSVVVHKSELLDLVGRLDAARRVSVGVAHDLPGNRDERPAPARGPAARGAPDAPTVPGHELRPQCRERLR